VATRCRGDHRQRAHAARTVRAPSPVRRHICGGCLMRTVVGARFMKAGRMYFFDPGAVSDYRVNDWIIVRTELGVDAARVQILPTDSPLVQVDPPLGKVVRKANGADKFEMARRKRAEPEASETAQRLANGRGLPVKLLGADWQF